MCDCDTIYAIFELLKECDVELLKLINKATIDAYVALE